MKIGIDADGVLTDMLAFYFKYGEIYFKRKPANPAGYSISEIFDCSAKQEFRFGLKYFITYCKKCPPRENCAEVIKKLNADNHELYEITARKFVMRKDPLGWYSRHMFENWLKTHGMEFKEIFYCSESNSPADKFNCCKKLGIDLMIDDRPNVALHLADKNVMILLFDAPFNKEVTHKNIFRVNNWYEVYERIREME